MIAIQTGCRQHHIHSGPGQSLAVHEFHVDHASTFVPDGLDAHQMQRLCFQNALMAHGLHRPQREGHLAKRLASGAAMRVDHLLCSHFAGLPRLRAGDARRIKAVEIPARGKGIGVLHRVTTIGRWNVFTGQGAQQRRQLPLSAEPRIPVAPLLQLLAKRLHSVFGCVG